MSGPGETPGIDPRTAAALRRFSAIASGGLVALGAVVLLGWIAGISVASRLHPSLAPMKANSAVLFIVLGVGLWSTPRDRSARLRRGCGAFVLAIGALSVSQDIFAIDLVLDQLLFEDEAAGRLAPGRMAPGTSVELVLFGLALLLVDRDARRGWSDAAVVLAGSAAFLALTGYAYGARALYQVPRYSTIALHTVLGLLVAAAAFFTARPGEGLTAALASDTAAGTMLRRTLPAIVGIPIVIGWLRLRGERNGFYDTAFGTALMASGCIGLLVIVVMRTARSLHVSELERRRAEARAQAERDQAERDQRFVNELSDALRAEVDSDQALQLAAAQLAAHLDVSRCAFLDVDAARGDEQAALAAGRTVVVGGQARATVAVPVFRDRAWIATLSVSAREPRAWTDREVGLIQLVAERTWIWIEHLRGLEALRRSNAELEERVATRTGELTASLKERDVLLQEVHHRVKNNLQVITSLINMQLRRLPGDGSRAALEECRRRVAAIALIHEKLYRAKDYAHVPFSDYVRSLAGNIFHASGTAPHAVALDIEIEELTLAVDRAIPCGLILNELISNALKHAFPADRRGVVTVGLRHQDARHLELTVGDDGVGMTDAIERATDSLGMSLVTTLVEQLDGTLDVARDRGTTFRIRFPIEAS